MIIILCAWNLGDLLLWIHILLFPDDHAQKTAASGLLNNYHIF